MDSKPPNNEGKVIALSSFGDIEQYIPHTHTLVVKVDEDTTIGIPVKLISLLEWMALDHAVPHVTRVQSGLTAQGITYDYNDPGYQAALVTRRNRIAFKRLAACLLIEVPGETNDTKADWLANYPMMGLMSAIYDKLEALHAQAEVSIVDNRIFRTNGANNTPHPAA